MLHRYTLHRSWDKNTVHLRSCPSIYMYTLQIQPKMTKSEKPPAPGVALSFEEVMKNINCRINWESKVSLWAQVCNWNCTQSSIKLTGLSMTTFVGNITTRSKLLVGAFSPPPPNRLRRGSTCRHFHFHQVYKMGKLDRFHKVKTTFWT